MYLAYAISNYNNLYFSTSRANAIKAALASSKRKVDDVICANVTHNTWELQASKEELTTFVHFV